MRRVAHVAIAALAAAVTAGACGTAYDEATAGSGDAGHVPDALASGDAATDAAEPTPPRGPPACPYVTCPDGTDACADETCTSPTGLDFATSGTTSVVNGQCQATSSDSTASSFSVDQQRDAERVHLTLAFRLHAVSATDRVIASVTGTGQAWQVVATNEMLALCEVNALGQRCTTPVKVMPGAEVYVFGSASGATPPNAAFALSVNAACAADRVLAATAPFTAPQVRGSIGCLGGSGACTVRFDDALFTVTKE